MASTDVIFNLGVAGEDGAAAGVNKLVGAFISLVKVTKEEIYEAQSFQQTVNNLTTDMSTFGKATANLVDTMESVKGANELVVAGAKATKKQIEAVGKAAVDTAQKTNKDATAQYSKLIKDIVKGSSRGLKELGIDLDDYVSESATLAEKQAIALELIEAKFGDITVEAETAKEKSFAFFNTVGTLKSQLIAPAFDNFTAWLGDSTQGATSLQWAMDDLSDSIAASEGELGKWITSAEGLANVSAGVWAEITGDIETATEKANEFFKAQQQAITKGKKIREERVKQQLERSLEVGTRGPKQRARGGKKKEVSDFIITEEEAELGLSQEELDFWRKNAELTQEQVEAEFFAAFSEGEVTLEDPIMALHMQRFQAESDAAFAHAQLMEDLERAQTERHAQEIQSRIDAVMNSAQATSGIMANLQKTMNKNSQAGFNAAKGLAIAQVAVDTPAAAMAAYKSVVGIPYVGPFLAVAAASAAVAAGVAQIANIKKQKFSPSGAGASAPSASAISAPSINASANQYGAGATQQESTTIINNVLVDGQVIHSSMINANNDASQRGEQSFATAV